MNKGWGGLPLRKSLLREEGARPKRLNPGAPGWLSPLSICLQIRSWSRRPGIQPCVGLPAQQGACFSPWPSPLLVCSLTLKSIIKILKKNQTNKQPSRLLENRVKWKTGVLWNLCTSVDICTGLHTSFSVGYGSNVCKSPLISLVKPQNRKEVCIIRSFSCFQNDPGHTLAATDLFFFSPLFFPSFF